MPRVLLLCEYATLNGGERSMLATLDGVREAGYRVSVAAPPVGPLAEVLESRRIEVLPFVTRDRTGKRTSPEDLRRGLEDLFKQNRPDLLHANSLSMGRLSGPVAAEMGLPSIAHLRDILRLSAGAVADLNCHRRLLAVSAATRRYHVAAGLAAEKTHVLYNGVALDRFCQRPSSGYLHRELNLAADVHLVGAIGQIGLRKGFDVLARAAVMLEDALPDVHYVIVGQRWSEKAESREFEANLQATAAGELSGRMHLLGVREDVDRLLNELSILVHPARQEPLGRVLLEAAASGVAIVASDVGGTGEIFPAGCGAARLVGPDDPGALAAAISELLGNEPLRRRMGAAGRRRAEEAFDIRRAVPALVDHYRQTCGV